MGTAHPPGDLVLRLNRVAVRYARWAPLVLKDVDLELRPGEVVHVVGANGSGKSSVIRLAAGTIRASAGTVERAGSVGFVPENVPPGRLSVERYLAHMAAIRGVGGEAAHQQIGVVLDQLGLFPERSRRMATLSKGTRQRAYLAQAVLHRPRLLLLDEPGTGLDGDSRAALSSIVTGLVLGGSAVLFTDHRDELGLLPTRLLTVRDGCAEEGPVAITAEQARLVRIEAVAGCRAGDVGQERLVPGDRMNLRVRSQDVDRTLLRLLEAGFSITAVVAEEPVR